MMMGVKGDENTTEFQMHFKAFFFHKTRFSENIEPDSTFGIVY